MNLRRTRVVACGAQNTDYRAQSYQRPENVARLEFISTCKSQKFDEIVKERLNKKAPLPLTETQQFYEKNQKTIKERAKISQEPKHLENMDVLKVFNGDSQVVPEKVEKAYLKKQTTLQNDTSNRAEEKQKIITSKQNQHASATQETQLVTLQKNKETLEGKIDLDKVRQIRQAIRRRYANRKNFQKIFNSWDEDSKGMIDAKNAYNMINKLGVKVNLDECRVLIASADEDQGGSINMDEFIRLIFDDNQALNVDLQNIPILDKDEVDKLVDTNALSSSLVNNKTLRHQNQIKQILKNKLNNLQTFMINEDQGSTDFINFERLQNVIKKLGIPESIINQQDIRHIFESYKLDDYKFEYKKLLKDLQEFEFVPEDIAKLQQELKSKDKKTSFIQQQIGKYNEINKLDDEVHVFNVNEVDAEHLERIRNNTEKVIFSLKRYFPQKKDFEEYVMKQIGTTSHDQYNEKYLKKDEMVKIVQNIFLNFGETNLQNFHIEGFLSSVQYNKKNFARTKDFSEVIYDEDQGQWYTKMQQKLKYPPPPKDDAFHPQYKGEEQGSKLGKSQEGLLLEQGRQKQLEISQNLSNAFIRSTGIQPYDQDLKKILKKIEDRVFCGTQKSYEIFKKFDVDKDGYVSQKDLISKVKEMNILNEQEIPKLLTYLDPGQKGYVNFQEFSSKIRSGVLDIDAKGNQIVESYMCPEKSQVEFKKSFLPVLEKKKQEMVATFNGDLQSKLKPSTRFGASPNPSNTFTSFQSIQGSGMYASDEQRFDRSHNHRLSYLKEEQQRKHQINQAKLEKRQELNNQIQQKVDNEFQRIQDKDEAKRQAKGIKQWSYEHRCHLQNDWK